jgi:hypothetical protein
MQETLLLETLPNDSRCGGKMQILLALLSGFGAAMVLLRPAEEPAINVTSASDMQGIIGRNIASPSGMMGAFPRLANQQRQPLEALKLCGLHPARAVVRMSETEEECALLKLKEAIEIAKACKGPECLVEWDNVEELSAAVAHSGVKSSKTGQKMAEGDLEEFTKIQTQINEAKAKLPPKEAFEEQINDKLLADIEKAGAMMEEVVVKFSADEMSQVEKKIQEAIKEAEASKSAVDWEIVEELMQQRSHLKQFGASA